MKARHTPLRHQPIADGLQALPGEWGLVGNYVWQGAAKTAARSIETGRLVAYQPAGSFEAQVRIGSEGDALVYARYIGTGEVAA
ncbi:hypothetical protein [Kitasatospora sp. A2-31]|uniref:hypothetical protein n=1 Tax=Kitasatospora sp. A2-31 TaxID=2916414 RepID=UPI001EE9195A|nr:hypothetical protein [Kitasatospora sp. A2-31]MCG6493389.1 hypothetical protein [Kitasatospora sp. A2-31]